MQYKWVLIVLIIALLAMALVIVALLFAKLATDPKYTWVDIILYAFIVILFFLVVVVEAMGGTLAMDNRLNAAKANSEDSCEAILNKTTKLVEDVAITVSWRIALIISFIISLFIWAFVMIEVPRWYTFYLTLIIVFVIVYGFLNYYTYHLGGRTALIVSKNLNAYVNKCGK